MPTTHSGINVLFPSKTQTTPVCSAWRSKDSNICSRSCRIFLSCFWIMLVGCGASFTSNPYLFHCFGDWPYSRNNIISLVDVQLPLTWWIWPINVDMYVFSVCVYIRKLSCEFVWFNIKSLLNKVRKKHSFKLFRE